jgi:hypothetical protein
MKKRRRRVFTEEDDSIAIDLDIRATQLMEDLANVVGEMTKLLTSGRR